MGWALSGSFVVDFRARSFFEDKTIKEKKYDVSEEEY